MRVVIVGGGKVGGFLARELRDAKHSVIVIERDPVHAQRVAEETRALAIVGDGTDLRLLSEVELRKGDLFVALTGADEDNLVACQLARVAFGVEKVLARLNDPRNHATFTALSVPVVSVTDLLVKVISSELDVEELVRVAILGGGEVSLLEVEVPAGLPSRAVRDVVLPESSVLVAIRRSGTVIVPGGDTLILPGDRVLAVTLVDLEGAVRTALTSTEVVVKPEGHPGDTSLTIEAEQA